jgi:hypothetical protein
VAIITRFLNGPSRTRSFVWTISASCSEGVTMDGSCSAFGLGCEFRIYKSGGTLYIINSFINGGTPTALAATAGVVSGTFSVSIPTREMVQSKAEGVGAALGASVSITEYKPSGSSHTATLSIGGITVSTGTFATITGVSSTITAKALIRGYESGINGNGSLSFSPPATMPYTAEVGTASYSGSGTGSASVDLEGNGSIDQTYAWAWSTTETASIGVSVSGSWSLLRTDTDPDIAVTVFPPGFAWNSGSTWRSEAYAESHTVADRLCTASNLAQLVHAPSNEAITTTILPNNQTYSFIGTGSASVALRYRRRWAGGALYSTTGITNATVTNHKSDQAPISATWKRDATDGWGDSEGWYGLRLWRWAALSLSHDSTALVDNGNSVDPTGYYNGTWRGFEGATVVSSSGAIRITGAAGKTVIRSFIQDTEGSPSGRMYGYNRLRIRLRCDQAAHSINIDIADRLGAIADPTTIVSGRYGTAAKRWEVQTGAADTWTNIYIDLSAEHNGMPAGSRSSRAGLWDGSYEAAGGHFLNVDAAAISFTGLGAGVYEIDEMELSDAIAQTGGAATIKLHVLGEQPDGTYRVLVGETGGNQSIEAFNVRHEEGIISLIQGFELPPQGGFGRGRQCLPGWHFTDLAAPSAAPVSTGEYNPITGTYTTVLTYSSFADKTSSDLPADYIGGTGILWDTVSSAPAWTRLYGADALGVGNIPAQWVVRSLSWDWPEALDSLPNGSNLGFAMIYGAGVWGRMMKTPTTGTSAPYRAPIGGEARGVGLGLPASDVDTINTTTGAYNLPSHGQPGFVLPGFGSRYRIEAKDSTQTPIPYFSAPMASIRRRVSLVEGGLREDAGECLSMAQSFTGRIVRGWSDSAASDAIVLEFRSQWGGSWERKPSGINGECPALFWDVPGAGGELLVVYVSSGIKMRSSANEGGTWSVATTISSAGSNPAACIGQSGMRYFVWYDSGAIKLRAYDSTMTERIAARTIVASGAGSGCISLLETQDNKLLLFYRTTGNVVRVVESVDGGLTFT